MGRRRRYTFLKRSPAMGREIKRVPLSFDWPMSKPWMGYVNPYYQYFTKCWRCDGSGESDEYKALIHDWYGLDPVGMHKIGGGTQYELTQEEVNLLVDEHRLCDLAADWSQETGWVFRKNPDGTPFYPDAALVNETARHNPLVHDAINQHIVCRHRAEKLGIEVNCKRCSGKGGFWKSEEYKEKCENFCEHEKYGPPAGTGWQVWETVSEGSPVTPVFETADELIEYLVENGDEWDQKRAARGTPMELPSREAIEKFVKGTGWVPSGAQIGGKFYRGIEYAAVMEDPGDETVDQ